MKVSISLPEKEVDLLDEYARTRRMKSRSAVVRKAVKLLQTEQLGDDYAAAWAEWTAADDSAGWERTTDHGISISDRPIVTRACTPI